MENFSVSLSARQLPPSLSLSPSLFLTGCGFKEANLCEWCGLCSHSSDSVHTLQLKEESQGGGAKQLLGAQFELGLKLGDFFSFFYELHVRTPLWPVLTLCCTLWPVDLSTLSVCRASGVCFNLCPLKDLRVSMGTNFASLKFWSRVEFACGGA